MMSAGSAEAALRAAGGAIAGVDAVMEGWARNAFAAVRPPGHHAEPARPMGFCLFNNVAVAALHARARMDLTRVAVVDFDVHHGNGTQAMFDADPEPVLRLAPPVPVLSRHRRIRPNAALPTTSSTCTAARPGRTASRSAAAGRARSCRRSTLSRRSC